MDSGWLRNVSNRNGSEKFGSKKFGSTKNGSKKIDGKNGSNFFLNNFLSKSLSTNNQN